MDKLNILIDIFGEYRRSGQEYLFRCQNCDHHKKKLSINIEKDKYHCWICNISGSKIKKLINRYGTIFHKNKWAELNNELDLSINPLDLLVRKNEVEYKEKISLPKEFVSLANKTLSLSCLEPLKYLYSRGLTKEDIIYWRIGYCPSEEYEGRIIIPSFDETGKINYFVARSYKNSIWPKYKNPQIKKDIVFNELFLSNNKPLIICEGIFDAIKTNNSLPLLGSELREDSKIFEYILNFDNFVYLILDKDAKEKQFKLIEMMLNNDIQPFCIFLKDKRDLGSMKKEEVKQLIKNNSIFIDDFDKILKLKMEI